MNAAAPATMNTAVPTTMRETFYDVVDELLESDPRLSVVLADIGAASLAHAAARHPARVLNVGIREQLMVSVAGGLALAGMRPVVHTFAPFLTERPFEQVRLDLDHQGVGAVLVSAYASYDWAEGGATHGGPRDVALLDTLNGWQVHVPGHPAEAALLLRRAIEGDERVYVRLSDTANSEPRPVGSGRMHLVREGTRGSVVAVGPMLDRVLAATAGLDVTVVYAATVRPFDSATLVATTRTPDIVLVEPYLAGTSSRVIAEAMTDLPHRLLALGVAREELRRYGGASEHDTAHGLDSRGLRRQIEAFLR